MTSKEFIKLCIESGIKNVQITINSSYETSIKMINSEIDKKQITDITTYIIKANYMNNTVTINSEYLNEDLINIIKEMATYTDNKIEEEIIKPFNLKTKDTFTKESIDDLESILKEVNDIRTKEYKHNKSITQEVSYNISRKQIVNSNGLDISSSNSKYSYVISSASEDKEKSVTDFTVTIKKDKKDLNIIEEAKEVLRNNELHLNEKTIKTKKYKLLLTPNITSELIKYLIMLIDSSNTNKDISYLKNKLNQKIFSDKLTIIEDPTDINSVSYRPFDDEGTKTSKKEIVKNGVLKTFLYNNKNAKEVNTKSTGNFYNGTIQYRNIYIKPQNSSIEELIEKMQNGIIVNDILLSSSALNVTTGVYNGQIFSGFLVENGKIKHAVKNAIFTTDLNELFNNIIDIGNNLEYLNYNIGAPALLIDKIDITGDNNEN